MSGWTVERAGAVHWGLVWADRTYAKTDNNGEQALRLIAARLNAQPELVAALLGTVKQLRIALAGLDQEDTDTADIHTALARASGALAQVPD